MLSTLLGLYLILITSLHKAWFPAFFQAGRGGWDSTWWKGLLSQDSTERIPLRENFLATQPLIHCHWLSNRRFVSRLEWRPGQWSMDPKTWFIEISLSPTLHPCECKFVCPTHRAAKQTEILESGAEKGWLQGQAKKKIDGLGPKTLPAQLLAKSF